MRLRRSGGFTLVELLLAIALSSVVAAILAAAIHALVVANRTEAARQAGPAAAHAALLRVAEEVSMAYRPPVAPGGRPVFSVSRSLDPAEPEIVLSFFAPVPEENAPPPFRYDIAEVAYAVQIVRPHVRELRRISHPCSGPEVEMPRTNVLLRGDFRFDAQVLAEGGAHETWPPEGKRGAEEGDDAPEELPPAVRLSIAADGEEAVASDVLIQAAHGIRAIREETTGGKP